MKNFCRDCANFVERRDIEGYVVCLRNHEPGISCPDFTPKKTRSNITNRTFCADCTNYVDREEIDGTAMCKRDHRPGISCDDFKDKRAKTVEHLITRHN